MATLYMSYKPYLNLIDIKNFYSYFSVKQILFKEILQFCITHGQISGIIARFKTLLGEVLKQFFAYFYII